MGSSLVLHRGAREVTLDQVQECPTPAPTDSHFPIPFAKVLEITLENLANNGFEPVKQRLALQANNQQFFATIDLKSRLAQGVALAAALRSSHDMSLPYGFVVGGRVFCCDNLSLSSDLSQMIRVKHTRFGETRFNRSMGDLVRTLPQFMETEAARIEKSQRMEITDEQAESLILRSWENGVISHLHVLSVLREFRKPSFPDFEEGGKTVWRLENAYTASLTNVLKTNPARYSRMSIALQALLSRQLSDGVDSALAKSRKEVIETTAVAA